MNNGLPNQRASTPASQSQHLESLLSQAVVAEPRMAKCPRVPLGILGMQISPRSRKH